MLQPRPLLAASESLCQDSGIIRSFPHPLAPQTWKPVKCRLQECPCSRWRSDVEFAQGLDNQAARVELVLRPVLARRLDDLALHLFRECEKDWQAAFAAAPIASAPPAGLAAAFGIVASPAHAIVSSSVPILDASYCADGNLPQQLLLCQEISCLARPERTAEILGRMMRCCERDDRRRSRIAAFMKSEQSFDKLGFHVPHGGDLCGRQSQRFTVPMR